jgi:hypothetical protein
VQNKHEKKWSVQYSRNSCGIGFGASWTTCKCPYLASIMTVAASNTYLHQVCLVCIFCLFSRSLILSRMVVDAFIIAFKRFLLWLLWVNRISAALLIEIAWILVTGMLYHYFLITMMKNSSLLTLIATSICYNTEISKIFITIVRMFLYGRGYRSIRDRQIDLR